ncbi:MAG: adenine phosphoribosyltransferase [Candidatus Micrarchaeia archaeon]|jgi:adenine phosphoribosyltransferase
MLEEEIKENIRSIPNYPRKGVLFRDITPLLGDGELFKKCIESIALHFEGRVDKVAGIEARGFIIGSAVAYRLGKGFIPIRKEGRLPFDKIKKAYSLEYGNEAIEIHKDALKKGERVLIVDDLLATGGTSSAACDLVESLGGVVEGLAFLIELKDLKGREKLKGREVFALASY